ncbi:MAG: hypothetical protein QXG98_00065 [Candidatus Micrarchaeia archaeon]
MRYTIPQNLRVPATARDIARAKIPRDTKLELLEIKMEIIERSLANPLNEEEKRELLREFKLAKRTADRIKKMMTPI